MNQYLQPLQLRDTGKRIAVERVDWIVRELQNNQMSERGESPLANISYPIVGDYPVDNLFL